MLNFILVHVFSCQCDRVVCYGERKQRAQNTSVTGGHINIVSSSVSESSSAEKSI